MACPEDLPELPDDTEDVQFDDTVEVEFDEPTEDEPTDEGDFDTVKPEEADAWDRMSFRRGGW